MQIGISCVDRAPVRCVRRLRVRSVILGVKVVQAMQTHGGVIPIYQASPAICWQTRWPLRHLVTTTNASLPCPADLPAFWHGKAAKGEGLDGA